MTILPPTGIIHSMAVAIKKTLAGAKAKLERLLRERKRIEREIIDWKRVVDSLTAVTEEVSESLPPDVEITVAAQFVGPYEPPSDDPNKQVHSPPIRLNFTDSIREILRLREASKFVPVPEIRDELLEWGFDFSKYRQELVPVHNALKRLVEQGEARPVKNKRGRLAGYQWIGPIERAMEGTEFHVRHSEKVKQEMVNLMRHPAMRQAALEASKAKSGAKD